MKKLLRHPYVIIGVIVSITAFFGIMVPRAQLDNDVMSFVPEDHPAKVAFDRLDELYQTDLAIVVAVHDPHGPILTVDGVEQIKALTDGFAALDHVNGVQSLTSIDFIEGTEEGMSVEDLAEGFDGSDASLDRIRRRLRAWEAYDGALISDDFQSGQIVIEVDPDLEAGRREAVYFAILDVIDRYEGQGYEFYVAGEPAITVLLSTNMQSDIVTLIPIVIIVVLISLLLFFRRAGGVILPMITVLVSTVWTIGLMALLGVKLSLVATVIPVLMIAVGSAYGIHIVNHFYDEVPPGGEYDRDARLRVVHSTLRRVGVPVLMAGLTTIVGFGALSFSEVAPMRDFGIFTAIGVAVALLVALTLIPALLVVAPIRGRTGERAAAGGDSDAETGLIPKGYLITLYHFFGRRKRRILIASVLIAVVATWGSSMLVVDNELIAYFKQDTSIRRADQFLRENFLGTRSFDINVVGEEPGDLTNPEILKAMDDLARWLEDYDEISRVLSYTDFIKRMNQTMNIGVPAPGFSDPLAAVASSSAATGASASSTGAASTGSPSGGGTWSSFADDGGGGGFSADGFSASGGDGSTDSSFAAEEGGADDGETGGFSDGFSGGFSSGESDDAFGSALRGDADTADSAPSTSSSSSSASPDSVGVGAAGAGGSTAVASLINDAFALANEGDISGEELIRLINRRTNFQGAAFYEIPYDPTRYPVQSREELGNLISQYLLLYSGSLENWSDDALEPSQARMSVQLLTTGNTFTRTITRDIQEYVDAEFPQGYSVEIAGVAIVERALTELITNAQIVSMIVSLSLVFLIVAFTYRSVVAGVFGVIPLALTLVINFGVMGFFGIKLDITTAMVASIAIGIGIDYTIHFLSAYHNERQKSDDLEMVERRVLGTTGKAITFNAISVAAGFAVLMLSNFNPLMYMGMLIALTMLTSSIASMTVLPVLLDVFNPKFMRRPVQKGVQE